jgi:putative ABC transport system ATP-binding protein
MLFNFFANFFAGSFVKYEKLKVDLDDDIENALEKQESKKVIDLKSLSADYTGLFVNSSRLVDDKLKYWFVVIGCSMVSFLSVYSICSKNSVLFLVTPIVRKLIDYTTQSYFNDMTDKVREKWKKIVLDYFSSLPYKSRRKTEMNDFNNQLNKTSWVFARTAQQIIPNIVEFFIDGFSLIYAIYMYFESKEGDNSFVSNITHTFMLVALIAVVMMIYYFYVIRNKQKGLCDLKCERKKINRKTVPLANWFMYLFQNKKRNVQEMIEVEKPVNVIDTKFNNGWCDISNEYRLFSTCVVASLVYFLSLNSNWVVEDWELLLKNMSIFAQITGTISMFTQTTNALETHIKDFDSLIEWIEKSEEQEQDVTQKNIAFPLKTSLDIKLVGESGEKLNLKVDNLTINQNDKILLKGKTGVGKTQLVNSLQGLVPGASFEGFIPKELENVWEYLNQQTREKIPSKGLSLRSMLEHETNEELVWELIRIVELEDKFEKLGLDKPMEDLSGGEKMSLSILYTIWDMRKREKQVLILDEPEQGLDETTRVKIIQNVLTRINEPVLVIYHGSKLDLLEMSFNKVWLFEKHEMPSVDNQTKKKEHVTLVEEKDFGGYKQTIISDIKSLFQ